MSVDFHAGTKRRRMRSFVLNEISSVDAPAVEPAVATLMKNKGAPSAFDDLVRKFRREGMSGTAALSRARGEAPKLYDEYQRQGVETVRKASAPPRRTDAVTVFTKRVDAIRRERKCSRTEAMSAARDEFPEEYEAYQRA